MAEKNAVVSYIQNSLLGQSESMIAWTRKLCDINSGSRNTAGIRNVNRLLVELFTDVSDRSEEVNLKAIESVNNDGIVESFQTVPALLFHINEHAPVKILCTGHSDTVFPKDSHFQSTWVDGNLLRGPGTADMKGGLVVMHAAIKAIMQSEWRDQLGFTVCISPDEEIGSPVSAELLTRLAKHHHLGMTYEPALADGTLAGKRKGSGNFSIVVKGKSAHAGREFYEGKNAVVAAALAAEKLSKCSSMEEKITLNVGSISGGGPVNVVPDFAMLRFNVRIEVLEQIKVINRLIKQIIEDVQKETGCELILHGGFNRPPKLLDQKHQQLFQLLESCGRELSIPIAYKPTGGCCEGNNLSAAGLVNIDTLGVRGANIHSDAEYACIDSFEERAMLSALLMLRFAEQHTTNEGNEYASRSPS